MRYLFLLLVLLGAASCSSKQQPEPANVGQLAFVNGKIYTVDDDNPWAEAVVVRDDAIIYVGDTAGTRDLIDESTDVRDLAGQLLLPGFIDTHAHPVAGGAYATSLSLDTWGTVDDWVRAIAAPEELDTAYVALLAALEALLALDLPGAAGERAVLRLLALHQWRRLVLRHGAGVDGLMGSDWAGAQCRARISEVLAMLPRPDVAELS